MFKTKYYHNYRKEYKREVEIQNIMKNKNFDRVRAVHQYDYNKEMTNQLFWSKF